MDPPPHAPPAQRVAPVILIAALIQGAALYGLHHATQAHQWPATHLAWLIALYAVAAFIPTTVQLLADQVHRPATWVIVTALAAVLFYFGWHQGANLAGLSGLYTGGSSQYTRFGFVLLVWWLLVLPFLQGRLNEGRWTLDYRLLFRTAWRNPILLAEAGLFTGLFWLILFLWQMLFSMLGIDFFRDLFGKPEFAYPVTALAFGCALHVIGSVDRLVAVALEQLLNVLKWLAAVAGVLLTLFTVALLLKLPGVLFTGQRTISAVWLLCLVAAVVLFWNAAYRDGTVDPPYRPAWVAQALRLCLPLAAIVALTALYALIVRAGHHGLTVERVWAFLVAGAAVMYSVGYAVAAVRKGPWLAGMARVNVVVALALVAVVGAALTPLLSPYRLAADSQARLILEGRYSRQDSGDYRVGPFQYLGFYCGEYGRRRLKELALLRNHPHADDIRGLAAGMLRQANPWQAPPDLQAPQRVAHLALYPRGHPLDPDLARTLAEDWAKPSSILTGFPPSAQQAAGVFADLDGDGVEEFVLLSQAGGPVYQKQSGHWEYIGQVRPQRAGAPWAALEAALAKGDVAAVTPRWKELAVGAQRFRVDAAEPPAAPARPPMLSEQLSSSPPSMTGSPPRERPR